MTTAAGHARVAELNASEPVPGCHLPGRAGPPAARADAGRRPVRRPAGDRLPHSTARRHAGHGGSRRAFRSRAAAWRTSRSASRRVPSLRLDDGTAIEAGAILSPPVRGARISWIPPAPGGRSARPTASPFRLRCPRPRRASSRRGPCTRSTARSPTMSPPTASSPSRWSPPAASAPSARPSCRRRPIRRALAPQLVAHGARFVPALAGAAIVRSPRLRPPAIGRRTPVHRSGRRHGSRLRDRRPWPVGHQHGTRIGGDGHRQHP